MGLEKDETQPSAAVVAVHVQDIGSAQDEVDMAAQGKVQELNRKFGLWSMVGFTATMMYVHYRAQYQHTRLAASTGYNDISDIHF